MNKPKPKDKPNPSVVEMSRLRNRNSATKRQLQQALREYHELEARFENVLETLDALPPITIQYKPRKAQSSTTVTAVGVWGDWHIGQVVKPDEVQGLNSFNYEMAERRMKVWVDSFLRWVDVQRQAYPIANIHILGVGDFIHGLIHLENLIYEEFEPTVAVVKTANLFANSLRAIAPHCENLFCDMLETDNHSRLTPKTMFTGRGKWSFGHLLGAMVEGLLRDCPNIKFTSHSAIKTVVKIQGRHFQVEHGNDVRAHMGIPYYGLERLRSREAERRANTGAPPFDYLIIGHFHTFAVLRGVLMNGSLCGTTPYDHAAARHALPSQMGFLVHPRRGVFNMVPFELRE